MFKSICNFILLTTIIILTIADYHGSIDKIYPNGVIKEQSRESMTVKQVLNAHPELANCSISNTGQTPIFQAVTFHDDQMALHLIQIFFDYGAELEHRDNNGQCICFIICAKGMTKCLNFVLKSQQQLKRVDRNGQTPIFYAVRENRLSMITELTIAPEILNITDKIMKQTVLFYAVAKGNEEMARYLIQKGANPSIRDLCGQLITNYAKVGTNFHKYLKKVINFQQKENIDKRKLPEIHRNNVQNRSFQAYSLTLIPKNAHAKRQDTANIQIIKQKALEKVKKIADNQDLCQGLLHYDEKWREVALIIVKSCEQIRLGKWFEDTSKFEVLSIGSDSKNDMGKVVDLKLVASKLEHRVYSTASEFVHQMNEIWVSCEKTNGKEHQICEYARQLKKEFYNIANSFDFFNKYCIYA